MKTTLVLFCTVLGVGCAGLSETALPRASHTLDGLKSFYFAMCLAPPAGKEQICEDGRDYVNEIGEFYNLVNEAIGEDQ